MTFLLAICAGILLASYSAFLPSGSEFLQLSCVSALALLVVFICFRRFPRLQVRFAGVVLGSLIGAGWSWGYGFYLQGQMLSQGITGKNVEVIGRIQGLPDVNHLRARFMLNVERYRVVNSGVEEEGVWYQVENNSSEISADVLSSRLRLSWYGAPELKPGQTWSLLVRVKPARGSVNPGGFDYQRWLLSRGVGATGYVRREGGNTQLSDLDSFSADGVRFSIREALQAAIPFGVERSLLLALALGDRSEISVATWQLLRNTGTVHLLAISGLHIGLVASFGYLFFSWLGRCLSLSFCYSHFYPYWGAFGAFICALFYALLAGLTLPTLRALIMVSVACLFTISARLSSRWQGFVTAMLLCLLLDPLAGFDPGFWLSFVAVAGLLLAFSIRELGGSPIKKVIQPYLQAQWVVFWALLIPLVLVGLPLVWIAPLVNLIAIPVVGLLVVPFLLVGILLLPIGGAGFFWLMASKGVTLLLWVLHALPQKLSLLSGDAVHPYFVSADHYWLLAIAGCCCIALLVPRLKYRWLAFAVLGLFFFVGTNAKKPFLRMTVLDVGQGLAVVVEVGEKSLLYDTGPRWGGYFSSAAGQKNVKPGGGSQVLPVKVSTAAESMVLPYLRYRGISRLDHVMVSHGDNDHQGGVDVIAEHVDVGRWSAGEVGRLPDSVLAESCHGQQWLWSGVHFKVLPWDVSVVDEANNHSCVLVVDTGKRVLVIPGDIEASRERLQIDLVPKVVDVLLAAHHGSATSSSLLFVQEARPRHVVVSAGYRNHYHHPHSRVLSRFERIGADVINTADAGAVTITVSRQGDLELLKARDTDRRYWYDFTDEL